MSMKSFLLIAIKSDQATAFYLFKNTNEHSKEKNWELPL